MSEELQLIANPVNVLYTGTAIPRPKAIASFPAKIIAVWEDFAYIRVKSGIVYMVLAADCEPVLQAIPSGFMELELAPVNRTRRGGTK